MSRRVYEVARELGLSTKEVMGRLNEAGVEAKSNLSVVEDPAYERVFGHDSRSNGSRSNGSGNAAPNARPQTTEAGAVPRRVRRSRERARKRSRERARASRTLAYVLVAALAFALAAGVGAVAAMVLRGDIELPGQEEARPSEQQDDARQAREQGGAPEGEGGADRARQEEAGAGQEEAPQQNAPQQDEGDARLGEDEYLSRVGDIQSEAVEIFMDSHNKLLLYDALTAQDIDVMRANEAALEEMAREADDLSPPQSYEEQHEVFASAITGLHEAARTAYELANDPVTAAETGFDGYDGRVNQVAGLLKRSNEMLGRDYETIGDPREISPQLGATGPERGPQEAAQT